MKFLFYSYSFFLSVFFLLFLSSGKHNRLFLITVLAPGLVYLRSGMRLLAQSRIFWIFLSYIGYMLASHFWSSTWEPTNILQHGLGSFYVTGFIFITVLVAHEYPKDIYKTLEIVSVIAAVVAAVVILIWYQEHPFPISRMEGAGRLNESIRSAALYGIFAIIALHGLLRSKKTTIASVLLLVLVSLLLYVIFTQSRTVILALAVAAVILIGTTPNQKGVVCLLFIGVVLGVIFVIFPELKDALYRDVPYRPYIWASVLDKALEAPVFGHGYLSDIKGCAILPNGLESCYGDAHNMFLASFRDGGLIGLVLFILLFVYACWVSFITGRATGNYLGLALVVYGYLCVTPNEWELLTKAKEWWAFFWLPIAIAMANEIMLREKTESSLAAVRDTPVRRPRNSHYRREK